MCKNAGAMMTGLDACRTIRQRAEAECVVNLDLLARALTMSKRAVLRDWRRRGLPTTTIGRQVLLPARAVIKRFPLIASEHVTAAHPREAPGAHRDKARPPVAPHGRLNTN